MKEVDKKNIASKFVNPFDSGVTYEQFLKSKGNKSIEDYCNENLTKEQILTLKRELEK